MSPARLTLAWLCSVLVACAQGAHAPSDPPSAEEIQKRAAEFKFQIGKRGGVLRDWIEEDLPTLNFVLATTQVVGSTLNGNVFETLFSVDPVTLAWEPELAVEVPSRSEDEDGRIYLVRLRKDVTWHDGKPFSAEDVVFTWNEVMANEAIPYPGRAAITMQVAEADGKKTRRMVTVEKADEHTVRFILPRRHPLFTSIINTRVLPKHVLKSFVDAGTFTTAWGTATPAAEIVGTGPFRVAEYKKGKKLVLSRYEGYWKRDEAGTRLPYLDGVEFRLVRGGSLLTDEFLAGRLDYLEMAPWYVDSTLKVTDRTDIEVVHMGPRATWTYLAFNQNPRSALDGPPYVERHKSLWFRDVRFRRAIAHTIDRDRIIRKVFAGQATSLSVPYSPRFPEFFTSDVPSYPFDLKKAGALLDEMDLKDRDGDGVREDVDGHPVEFTVTSTADIESTDAMLKIVQDAAAKAGIRLKVQSVRFNVLVERIHTSWDWEAVTLGTGTSQEPLLAKALWKSGEARRIWNPSSPPGSADERDWEKRLDSIFEEAYTAWDPVKREFDRKRDITLAHEWQRLCAENLPHIYLFSTNMVYFFSKRVRNRRSTMHSLYDIERLYMED